MKKTTVNFSVPADVHAAHIAGWKAHAETWAQKIEAGEQLTKHDAALAAHAIRQWARNLPVTQKAKVGQRPRVDAGSLAFEFVALTAAHSDNHAHEILAERHGVSLPAIKKALGHFGDAAFALVGRPKKTK